MSDHSTRALRHPVRIWALVCPLFLVACAGPEERPAPEPVRTAGPDTVLGLVVDRAGQPLGEVRWWIHARETRSADGTWEVEEEGLPYVRTTPADGTFQLEVPQTQRVELAFDADGYKQARMARIGGGDRVTVTLRSSDG